MMRSLTTSAVAISAALLMGLAGASPALAKAHDQSATNGNGFGTPPGVNVGAETVQGAHGLGANQGKEMNAGNSENAGRPTGDYGSKAGHSKDMKY